MRRVLLPACVLVFAACATCPPPPPTPAPEIIRVEVPVPIPCPAVDEVPQVDPLLPLVDIEAATEQEILQAIRADYAALYQAYKHAVELLEKYKKD